MIKNTNLKSIYSYKILMLLDNTDKPISIPTVINDLKTCRANAVRGIFELKENGLIEQVGRDRWEKFYRLKC